MVPVVYNDTLRADPFMVDNRKFSSENLEKHFKLTKDNHLAVKYTLSVYVYSV